MGCRWQLLVVGAVVMGASAPRPAHACSPPHGVICTENIDVFAEIAERPTNACIVASWSLSEAPGGGWDAAMDDGGAFEPDAGPSDFVYVASDGTVIALLPGALRCPERELEPRTEYAIFGPTVCGTGPPREHARFTTGAGPDTTPPSAPGEVSISCFWETCDSGACCGPYTATIIHSSWEPATDDSGVVLYGGAGGLRRGTSTSGYEITSGAVMFGQIYSGSGVLRPGGRVGGVVAIDIAGNRSAPGPASPPCPDRPDAAVDASIDAGASGSADAGAPGAASQGCSARERASDEGVLAAIGFLWLGALARRRARRTDSFGVSPSRRRSA